MLHLYAQGACVCVYPVHQRTHLYPSSSCWPTSTVPSSGLCVSEHSSGGLEVVSRRRHWSSLRHRGRTWLPGNVGVLLPDESDPPHCKKHRGGSQSPVTWSSAETESRHCLSSHQSIKVINRLKRLTAMGMVNTVGRLLTLSSMPVSVVSLISSSPLLCSQTVPLVVCSYQTGPVHSQDAISDPQSAIRGSRSVGDQSPDVNTWSVERSVLQEREVFSVPVCYYLVEHVVWSIKMTLCFLIAGRRSV